MRGRTKLLLVLVLIALPIAARWAWFYRGWYRPPAIAEIDESQIEVPVPEYRPSAAEVAETVGRVVIDLAHQNNLEVDDLTPLRDRLTALGVAVETWEGYSGSLESELRGAIGLVIVAPTSEYSAEEQSAISDFVEDGGRVLLAADPTRPVPAEEDAEDLASVLLPTSAVPAINSAAQPLGVLYFDDYLYNLVLNEGNYRNVKLNAVSDEHSLTERVQTVIFFAAHSLRSDGISLLSGDENTLSSLRTGETDLTSAALAAEGRVLALGDLTAITAPYHTVADNDQFLGNIADWLASAVRDWDLRDFPYLFRGPVDLVQAAGDFLDPRLVAGTDMLEDVLARADLTLNVRATADPDHDALFVGTFENADFVQEYLDAAGVTISIVGPEEGEERATPTPLVGGEAETEEGEEEPQDTVEVEGLGTLLLEGTTLFVVDDSPDRVAVIALAEDGEAVINSLDRLAAADFSGCVEADEVTVCSTGEVEAGAGLDTGPEVRPEEPEEAPSEGEAVVDAPRIGSQLESEVAFFAGTPWLEELAEESYEDTSQAGQTYEYTIEMEESQNVMWVYGWCAATKERLTDNWDNIGLNFALNEEPVPLDSLVKLESTFDEEECRLYYTLLTEWPSGQHVVTTEVTFTTELDDGFDIYPAGTHSYQYEVTVGG